MRLLSIPSISSRKVLFVSAFCVISLLVVFSGCSVYQNLTGYFNTYYNAKRLFSEAEDEIRQKRQSDIDSNYFAGYIQSKSTDDKFDKVIEKCSKLLESYSESKWVDDAILMIGKSYVYKGESESALRKFQELLDNFPGSDLRFETNLWYAKARYYAHEDDDALKKINELLPDAQSNGKQNIVAEAYMLQGQIFSERGEFQQAAESFGHAADAPADGEIRAIAQYQAGQNDEKVGDYDKAATAYYKVLDQKPDISLEFRSRLNYGKMLARTKRPEKALEVFRELGDEQLRPEENALDQLEIANTYAMMGDTGKAFAIYTLVDTTYKRTDASAKSHYQRGLIFENNYSDFVVARRYYDIAKDEFANSEITPFAKKKSAYLAQYFGYLTDLKNYDSLLYLLLHPDTTQKKKNEILQGNDSSGGKFLSGQLLDTLSLRNDTTHSAIKSAKKDSVGKGSAPPGVKNDDFAAEEQREVPASHKTGRLRPNTRDDDADSVAVNGVSHATRLDSSRAGLDSLRRRPRAPMKLITATWTPDSVRARIRQTQFELGGLFFLQFELPDSALLWYSKVVTGSSDSLLVPRALYALSDIYLSRNDIVAADSLYRIILLKFSTSVYANEVRKHWGMKITADSKDPAEEKYQEASNYLQSGNTKMALKGFGSLAKKFPASPLAPKAKYTEGWIYENVLFNTDSAASCYHQLLQDYPSSVYAMSVKPKVEVKDDPTNLQKYIKDYDVESTGKVSTSRDELKRPSNQKDRQKGEDIQKGRGKERGDEDESTDEDEPDTSDDDDNNN